MTTQNSGVEFWLKFAKVYGDEDQIFHELKEWCPDAIHVIEYSAYLQAIARAEKAEALLEHREKHLSNLLVVDKIESLEAEVKRLKKALEEISKDQWILLRKDLDRIKEIAKQALEGDDDWG